jgi:hypothetical protein
MYVFHLFSACVLNLMINSECILPYQDIVILLFKLRHSAVLCHVPCKFVFEKLNVMRVN